MSVVLGVDLGTTTITALALDTDSGDTCRETRPNDALLSPPADRARGYSEWDADRIVSRALECLAQLAQTLGSRVQECVGLGITGQQHGVILVDRGCEPLLPFINWQDQRANEPFPGTSHSYLAEARSRLGPEAPPRLGCQLAAGYLGATLFWLRERDSLPEATACFLGDFLGCKLTGASPVCEPTYAASSGLVDLARRDWDAPALAALGLLASLFPPIREAGTQLGCLTRAMAEASHLPEGLPVYVAIGDNQAAFLGCVADRDRSMLVNVGTGAQVAAYTEVNRYQPPLEVRPFPQAGNLLVNAGLSGGRIYALVEQFFRRAGSEILGVEVSSSLYARMNERAGTVPPGAGGLRCEPFFAGTRTEPDRAATFTGASAENFTPAHLIRAVLEGMARALAEGHQRIVDLLGRPFPVLVGGGNGLRENPVLAQIVAEAFGRPLTFGRHSEEATVGAALTAAVGAGVFADLASAGRLVASGRSST
jgi:sugar (pentulose or hexulose) kinase